MEPLPSAAAVVSQPQGPFFAAFEELAPERVDLFLVLATHNERDGLAELEFGAAVQNLDARSYRRVPASDLWRHVSNCKRLTPAFGVTPRTAGLDLERAGAISS
jgi:hypothetical protein